MKVRTAPFHCLERAFAAVGDGGIPTFLSSTPRILLLHGKNSGGRETLGAGFPVGGLLLANVCRTVLETAGGAPRTPQILLFLHCSAFPFAQPGLTVAGGSSGYSVDATKLTITDPTMHRISSHNELARRVSFSLPAPLPYGTQGCWFTVGFTWLVPFLASLKSWSAEPQSSIRSAGLGCLASCRLSRNVSTKTFFSDHLVSSYRKAIKSDTLSGSTVRSHDVSHDSWRLVANRRTWADTHASSPFLFCL